MALKVGELFAEAQMDTGGFTSGISTMSSKLSGFKGKALAAFGGITAAVTGLTAALGVKAVSAASDYESAAKEMEKVMDPGTYDKMKESVKGMSEEMMLSKKDLTAIAASAGRLGVEGTKNMEEFTTIVAKMGVATDIMGDEAAKSLKKIIDMSDATMGDIGNLGNSINELSNNMGTSASEIINASVRSASSLSMLGASSKQIVALNATMNTTEYSGRLAATGLEMMKKAMMKPGDVKAISKAMGMSTDKFKEMRDNAPVETMNKVAKFIASGSDKADKLNSALGESGTRFAKYGTVVDKYKESMEMVNGQWGDGSSLQEEFTKQNDTLKSKMQQTKDAADNLAVNVGDKLLDPIKNLLDDAIKPAIQKFSKWADKTDSISDLFDDLSNLVGEETAKDLKEIAEALGFFLKTTGEVLSPTLRKSLDVLASFTKGILALMTGDFDRAGKEMKNYLQDLAEMYGTLFQKIVEKTQLNKLVEGVEKAIKGIKKLLNKIPGVNFDIGTSGDQGRPTLKQAKWTKQTRSLGDRLMSAIGYDMLSGDRMKGIANKLSNISKNLAEQYPSKSLLPSGMTEGANILEYLFSDLEGQIAPKTATEKTWDVKVLEGANIEGKVTDQEISKLSRLIQNRLEDRLRGVGDK